MQNHRWQNPTLAGPARFGLKPELLSPAQIPPLTIVLAALPGSWVYPVTYTHHPMQKELKRIHVLQSGVFLGALYAALGLIIGILYALFFLAFGAIGLSAQPAGGTGTGPGGAEVLALFGGFGIVMAIIIPIFYGFFGFIGGIILAAIYNLVAKFTGGLKFDVVDVGPGTF